jgi:hypothetical protein
MHFRVEASRIRHLTREQHQLVAHEHFGHRNALREVDAERVDGRPCTHHLRDDLLAIDVVVVGEQMFGQLLPGRVLVAAALLRGRVDSSHANPLAVDASSRSMSARAEVSTRRTNVATSSTSAGRRCRAASTHRDTTP